jgi:L-lactate permease
VRCAAWCVPLVSLGHDPQRAVLVLVMLNTLSSHFSSVGMAIWFGFQSLGELSALCCQLLAHSRAQQQ